MPSRFILPDTRRGALRRLFDSLNRPVRLIEAHNGLSALIGAGACITLDDGSTKEFDGIWLSSLTESASHGLPDVELCGLGPRVFLSREVANVTSKPIVVDGDTGGTTAQIAYYTRVLEDIGVSALVIEDQVYPKCNSLALDGGQEIEDAAAFSRKIAAAKAAQRSVEFMVIARVEALVAGCGLDEAVRRAKDYVEAGADALVMHSRQRSPEEMLTFAARFRELGLKQPAAARLIAIPTTYNSVTEEQLYGAGYRLVIHANHLLRSAYLAMQSTAQSILSHGRSLEIESKCVPPETLFEIVGHSASV